MKKSGILLLCSLMLISIVFILAGCSESESPSFENITVATIEDQARVNNSSIVTYWGEYRYGGVYNNNNNAFVREKKVDGTDGKVIFEGGIVTNIAMLNDSTMFFIISDSGDKSGLYRSGLDGGGLAVVAAGDYRSLQIFEGKAYYSGASTEHKLFSYDPVSGATATVLNKTLYFPYVYGDKIMYQDNADGETLHLCNMDGSDDKRITNAITYSPIYDGEYVYYINGSDNHSVNRVKIDGSDAQKLTDFKCNGTFLLGDKVVFRGVDTLKLFIMDKDGSNQRVISEQIQTERPACPLDGSIYFRQKGVGITTITNIDSGSTALLFVTQAPVPPAPPEPTNKPNTTNGEPKKKNNYDYSGDPGDGYYYYYYEDYYYDDYYSGDYGDTYDDYYSGDYGDTYYYY